jgi:hypothetical protein
MTLAIKSPADALDKAHRGQDDRAPNADRRITRHKTDREGREPGQEEGRNQCNLAADAVAVMTKKRRANRPRDKADSVDAKGLQRTGQRVG